MHNFLISEMHEHFHRVYNATYQNTLSLKADKKEENVTSLVFLLGDCFEQVAFTWQFSTTPTE